MDKYKKHKHDVIPCKLSSKTKLLFGSGGSKTIIAVTPNHRVYKYFPLLFETTKIKKSSEYMKLFVNEIKALEYITKSLVITNLTPHYIMCYNYKFCDNGKQLFSDCLSIDKYLLTKKENTKCEMIYRERPYKIYDKYVVLYLEYAPKSLTNYFIKIKHKKTDYIKLSLDVLFFQIAYTLIRTWKIYPYFIHGDLFIRNILGQDYENKNEYFRYHIGKNIYDVPTLDFTPKISDFGEVTLNNKYKQYSLVKDYYNDWYNIVFDIYDGNCHGGKSLSALLSKSKKPFLKKYFSNYLNINVIDKITKNGKRNHLIYSWAKTHDENFVNLIGLKSPFYMIEYYFSKLFEYNPNHKIAQEFGN
jgi:hypothetical protein